MKQKEKFIADFDSTTAAFTTLANFLNSKGTNSGGVVPEIPAFAAKLINAIPERIRGVIYRWSGWFDAFPPERLNYVKDDNLSQWTVDHYPKRKYPGIMIGSANGGGAYLCSAMHIPFLPQTFLLPVRRSLHADDLHGDIEWGKKYAAALLDNNPSLRLHQMHDPLQDRLMVEKMAYFRIKKIKAGRAYVNFIRNYIEDNGFLFSLECTLKWPVVKVSDRHYFQSGGLGALDPGELKTHTPEIEKFLKEHNAANTELDVPETDMDMPEAEWGFLPELLDDFQEIIKEKKLKLIRIVFENPDDLSPVIADLYRWWYTKRNMNTGRLIAECFALIDPWRTQKKSCIPYWLAFNTQPSADAFEDYLNQTNTPEEIYIRLMSNGIKSIGITPAGRWEEIISRAKNKYSFLGMDKEKYPLDLGSYGRFHAELEKEIPADNPLPARLALGELEEFIKNSEGYKVKFIM